MENDENFNASFLRARVDIENSVRLIGVIWETNNADENMQLFI